MPEGHLAAIRMKDDTERGSQKVKTTKGANGQVELAALKAPESGDTKHDLQTLSETEDKSWRLNKNWRNEGAIWGSGKGSAGVMYNRFQRVLHVVHEARLHEISARLHLLVAVPTNSYPRLNRSGNPRPWGSQ